MQLQLAQRTPHMQHINTMPPPPSPGPTFSAPAHLHCDKPSTRTEQALTPPIENHISDIRKADLDLRQRACRKADQLLNQYFVFVGRHESRHVASSLLLTYVFSLDSTTMTSGGGGAGGNSGPGEEGKMREIPQLQPSKREKTVRCVLPPYVD